MGFVPVCWSLCSARQRPHARVAWQTKLCLRGCLLTDLCCCGLRSWHHSVIQGRCRCSSSSLSQEGQQQPHQAALRQSPCITASQLSSGSLDAKVYSSVSAALAGNKEEQQEVGSLLVPVETVCESMPRKIWWFWSAERLLYQAAATAK